MQYPTSAISRSAHTLRRPHQTNPVRHIARLMVLVALFGVGGGCPQNLPPEAEWIDPTETTGTVSETSGVEGDDGPSADNPLYVSDLAAATVQGQPVTLTLSAEVPSGVSPESGGQLFLSIVSAPYKGFVGPPEPIALDKLSAVYTPPDDFAGECYFTYVLYDGTRSSNVGTVSITVYPRVYFTVEPADGPGDLTVHTYAYTLGGHSLPDGTYMWSFDGEEDSGPMATHWERWHTFAPGSLQVVTLSVTLAGLATPLGCVKSPEISGWVADGSGAPLARVEIAASDVKAVITDNEGQYRLPVPHLWSGTVKASRPDHTFDPPSRVYANLTEDVAEQNFAADGGQPPNQPGDVMISGYVRGTDGIGMTGVTLSASNGGGSTITYGDGHYELTVPNDWSGTVVPTHPGYTFSPPSRSYGNVTADDPDEGYQGTANPVNGPPVVYDQTDVTPEDTKKVLTLSGSDPDNDDLTFEIVSGPSHGVLVEMDNSPTDFATVMYTPDEHFNGQDNFTFSAHDGQGGVSAVASFTITVNSLNDAPVIDQGVNFSLVVEENSSADDNHFNLSATDPDQGTILTWSISADPTHGTAAIVSPVNSSPGEEVTFNYAPDPDYTGADSFAIFVNDNDGGSDSIVIDVAIGGFHISGTITRPIADGTQAVPDLTLAFTGDSQSGTATTYADGHYTLFVPVGWSGTVQAQDLENWVLTPDHLDYANVQESLEDQDYSAVRNYYVDDDGSQQPGYNPGDPLGTINHPYDTIQAAADSVNPGDTVYVKAGTYIVAVNITRHGTQQNRITFTSYQGDLVTIDGQYAINTLLRVGHTGVSPGPGDGSYVTVEGFELTGAVSWALHVVNNTGVVLRNLEVHHNNTTGIGLHGYITDAIVEDSHVHHNGRIGIWSVEAGGWNPGRPTNTTVRRCYVHHNGMLDPEDGDGILFYRQHYGEIAYNIVHDNSDDGIDCVRNTHDVSIHHNVVFGQRGALLPNGGDGNGIKVDTSSIMEYGPSGSHTIHHNVVFCNSRGGTDYDPSLGQAGNDYYNNTLISNGASGIHLDAGARSNDLNILRNNILKWNRTGEGPYSAGYDIFANQVVSVMDTDYNFVGDGHFSHAGGIDHEGPNSLVAEGVAADPLFVDPYIMNWATEIIENSQGELDTSWQGSLQATMDSIRSQVERAFGLQTVAGGFAEDSPCLNAGAVVPGITVDFMGSAPEMGAIETLEP